MTIPTFLGISSIVLTMLIDMVYVGVLGTIELAAVTLAFPVVLSITSVSIGIGIGATSIMSRIMGSGDPVRCIRVGTHALLLGLLIVAAVAILVYAAAPSIYTLQSSDHRLLEIATEYTNVLLVGLFFLALPMIGGTMLRALGDAKSAGIIMVTGSVIQITLAPLFIFGLGDVFEGWGVLGSAWAMFFSRSATALYALYVFYAYGFIAKPGTWLEIKESWREIMRLAVPSIASQLTSPISMGILLAMLSTYAYSVVAAFGVALRVESVALIILMALTATVAPIVGQNFGARCYDRVRETLQYACGFSLLWGILSFVTLLWFGESIAEWIRADTAVVDVAYVYLFWVPLTFGPLGITMITGSSFIALGKPLPSFAIAVMRTILVLIPAAYLMSLSFGYAGIFMGIAATNVLVGCISYYWFKIELSRSEQEEPGPPVRLKTT